ncbi:glycoside hydrolase domain-containing protein [Nocardioides pyridinolyticus]
MFLGFDRADYPGDGVMASLYEHTPLYFVCVYLPAPSNPGTSWRGKHQVLRDQGWGFLPTFVGQQVIGLGSHVVTAAQGRLDGDSAAARMAEAGFPVGSVVYLDIENGGQLPAHQVEYIKAWIDAVNNSPNVWPGVYCSKKGSAAQVAGFAPDIPIWVYGPRQLLPATPAGGTPPTVVFDLSSETAPAAMHTDFPAATAWQYVMSLNCRVDLHWLDQGSPRVLAGVDVDCATVSDPSFAPEREADAAIPPFQRTYHHNHTKEAYA